MNKLNNLYNFFLLTALQILLMYWILENNLSFIAILITLFLHSCLLLLSKNRLLNNNLRIGEKYSSLHRGKFSEKYATIIFKKIFLVNILVIYLLALTSILGFIIIDTFTSKSLLQTFISALNTIIGLIALVILDYIAGEIIKEIQDED